LVTQHLEKNILFTLQGKFYQCKKEGGNITHHFHKPCQVFKDGKFYCPHCGEDSEQFEVSLRLHEPRAVSSFFIKAEDAKTGYGIMQLLWLNYSWLSQ
jgi:transcription initiation factor IIE alpha subunit